jgi:hypothetical protein
MKIPVGPSEASVASSMIGSLASVTVSPPPVRTFMSVAVNLPLASSPGATALNLMAGNAWAYRTVIMFSAAFDEIDGVIAVRVEDLRITGLYYVRNPQKLTRIASETPLTLK